MLYLSTFHKWIPLHNNTLIRNLATETSLPYNLTKIYNNMAIERSTNFLWPSYPAKHKHFSYVGRCSHNDNPSVFGLV